ncbi:hypothetical protein ACEQ8H_006825 [Pleosporales sp. CAS-2024a]
MTQYDDYGIPVGAFVEPEDVVGQARRTAKAFYQYRLRPLGFRGYHAARRWDWSFRRQCTLANALAVLWWVVLYWGERGTFNSTIATCSWDKWEHWEPGANPHRLVFVADPQLIDPHTYPGRPWPLNPLAYKYTDLYLRRTYSRLQTVLYPDTIFFLGDLFDGGREWSTRTTQSPEERYRRYGDGFWLNEYRRYGGIFFKHWGDAGVHARPGQPGRKIISSLPGNHDLGFARGVQVGVRNRFSAYFGDGNRIDVIANHTFVSIDSLSLSALGQDSPQQVEELWRPTVEFLEKAKTQKKRLTQRELRRQQGLRPYPAFPHRQIEAQDLKTAELPHSQDEVTEFPTILLTHIPLFRAPGTPCGPLREHWPPTPPPPGKPPLEKDERNAIDVSGGYQYQNVLNKEITVDVANKIGDIRYAFSGDDHDYCEVVHRGYASGGGGIREITVKSTSWAMGVRHPGVVLVSLWNPVDKHGNPLRGSADATMQTKLCLFPDQIGTFIRYGTLFGLTLVLLCARATLVTVGIIKPYLAPPEVPLLPRTKGDLKSSPQKFQEHPLVEESTHSSHSSTSSERGTLQSRNAQARNPRGSSSNSYSLPLQAANQYPSYPLVQHAGYHGPAVEEKKVKIYGETKAKAKGKRTGLALALYQFQWTLGKVMALGAAWYFCLIWMDRQ